MKLYYNVVIKLGRFINIMGETFGEWLVKEYVGSGKWRCECSCGTIENVLGTSLRNGKSTRCKKHPKFKLGSIRGNWELTGYLGGGMYLCTCILCGNTREIRSEFLGSYSMTKCSCMGTNRTPRDKLEGKVFGYLRVLEYVGYKTYRCECLKCGNTEKTYRRSHLIKGFVRSCGCISSELCAETMLNKYGETNTRKIKNSRERWQIEVVSSKENMENYLKSLGRKVMINELCDNLGLNKTNIYLKLHKYKLEDYIEVLYSTSYKEEDLARYIESLGVRVRRHVRGIIDNYEFDIFIPDKNIAIEFNGTYWHSELYKDYKYHQNKSILAIRKNIRLIHIFEYEWDADEDIIKMYIKHLLGISNRVYYARNTIVKEIDSSKAREFCLNYHLDGYAVSSINLGCYSKDDELLGVMTFGKPRFNSNYDYEVVRLCWKNDVNVVGGSNKMFKHFIRMTDARSVITYIDFAKFTGEGYLNLGFEYIRDNVVSVPNYVWTDGYSILSRYQTQRNKLDDHGNSSLTEDDIMEDTGYTKVYDCGNLRMQYIKEE